jgi:hypothetical protein
MISGFAAVIVRRSIQAAKIAMSHGAPRRAFSATGTSKKTGIWESLGRMALTYLSPVRPERRPKSKAEVEGHPGDGLSMLGDASTPPAARATLSANG